MASRTRAVGLWLAASAAMVFIMMLIGAITRLTESGLSMVEWRPLIGALPPLSEAEWVRVFELYRQTSEYQLANAGMTLAEFKAIFWWEYIHRLWGRLIGVVYAVPFFFFLWRGWIPAAAKPHLWILLALGGLQGVIGWWMVKSGFVDRTDVSQYRLALHLGMAFFILGYLFWMTLNFLWPVERGRAAAPRGFRRLSAWTHAVVFVTVVSGAFVAGSNAGFIYNDWPLMNGALTPDDFWTLTPWWASAFEEHGVIQFNHRLLAYATVGVGTAVWIAARRIDLAPRARLAVTALVCGVWLQAALGVATLVLVVPITLATLHQAGAATVFCLTLWLLKEVRGRTGKA